MHLALQTARLYGIIDLGYVQPENILMKTQALLAGGVGIIQLRAKGIPQDEIKQYAQQIMPLCRQASVPFILNDYPLLAAEIDADGVHIGQDDGTIQATRSIIGKDKILGRSTHSLEQAKQAYQDGFDYLGFGPIYPTPTKAGRPAIGCHDINQMQVSVGTQLPVFCIGGIHLHNLEEVIQAGAQRVVMVSGLLQAEDTTAACQSAIQIMNRFSNDSV